MPEGVYSVPIGKGIVRREGSDVTLVAISSMVREALIAADILADEGVSVEVIDPRSLKPLDFALISVSVKKTGRVVIADTGWKTNGVAAEISALITENLFHHLKVPTQRVALPDLPAPAARTLEKAYYPTSADIVAAIKRIVKTDCSRNIV